MSLFDQPWHIIILLLVVLLLFGSSRLPGAAKALGQSMHIFKHSMKGMEENQNPEDNASYAQATVMSQPAQPAAQPVPLSSSPAQPIQPATADPAHQAQLDDLQRQIQELQRLSATGSGSGAPVADAPVNTSN